MLTTERRAAFFIALDANMGDGEPMSKNLAEIHTSYQLHHIDARTGQVLAMLQSAAIFDDQLISTKQLAALLGVSDQWVEIGRSKGLRAKVGRDWAALHTLPHGRCCRLAEGAP